MLIHLFCGNDSGNTVVCEERFPIINVHSDNVTPVFELVPREDRIFTFDGLQNHYQVSGNKHLRITMVVNYD